MLRRLSFAAVLLAAVGLAVSAASAQPLRPVPVETGLSALAAAPASRPAAALPPGFYLETVASGLDTPVGAAFAPDGRMFVLEKAGRVVVRDGAGQRVLLDLTAEVLNQGDRGLLGIALDPAFARTGFLFLSYVVSRDGADTQRTDAFSRVTRYTVGPSGAVVAGSRRVLVGETFATGIPACYYSHAIGTLGFGADGTLLVGTGDAAHYSTVDTGGLYADCFGPDRIAPAEDVGSFRSQLLTSLAGKILRLDAATGKGLPSNPFWTGNPDDTASKVWALGFRNPFRFDVDTALGSADPAAGNPGPIHLGDVGWDRYEEIQTVRRGQNYGWPCREGFLAQFGGGSYPNTTRGQAVCPGLVAADPTFAWNHQDASASTPPGRRAFAVVGGAVYRGTSYPAAYRGQFFYTDYAAGWLASATISAGGALVGDATFSSDTGPVVDLAFDPLTQDLHLVDVGSGVVSRLRYTGGGANTAPIAVASGSPSTGLAPLTVRFSSTGTADPDGDNLSYAWAFGTGATATGPSPSATYTAAGQFTARLTVTDARGATATADVPITVRSSGAVPVASIEQPSLSARTLSGQTLALVALATDADAGQTATLAYRWNVTLVHNTHEHPDAFAAATRTAAYTVPFHGDSGESYALLVRLTVTDATGLTTVVERTVPIGEPAASRTSPRTAPSSCLGCRPAGWARARSRRSATASSRPRRRRPRPPTSPFSSSTPSRTARRWRRTGSATPSPRRSASGASASTTASTFPTAAGSRRSALRSSATAPGRP